jgi:signal transduction histidine kinase
VRRLIKFGLIFRSGYPAALARHVLNIARRHNAIILLWVVCSGATLIGAFMARDLQKANVEAREIYTRSVRGLQRIGELQFDAQETRRATLYALTTSDSNLQVEYADQSRAADQRVKDEIADYYFRAEQPVEKALANRLALDWASYLNVRDEVLASILEGSTKEAVSLDLSRGVPAFERIRQDLNEVKRDYDTDAARREANLLTVSRNSTARVIGILCFTYLLSISAVWTIQRGRMLSTMELAKLQMEFVASVSHELRTPLAVLQSAADNFADGLVEGKAALGKYGSIVQHQCRNMADLVDQILLFASTEDGKNRYIPHPVEIAPIIDSTVAGAASLLRGAGFILETQVDPELPLVLGDSTGISQCLHNLIANAVKYGGDRVKRVELRAFAAPFGEGLEKELRISVSDQGIGIDSSELAHIFDPFYRSPRVHAAQIHGTGLGLSLAKRIAESMGGRLSVVSGLSAGSTFTLHLQITKGKEMVKATPVIRPTSTWVP